jgi:hypothetical protein
LYGVLRPIVAGYPPEVVTDALREGRKGDFAQVFTGALVAGSPSRFSRALDQRPDTTNHFRLGLFHLRHSGVRHTLSLTQHAVTNRFGTSPVAKALARRTPSTGPLNSTQGDVMFGLMVLQQRLDELEAKLDRLSERRCACERPDGTGDDSR